VININLPQGGDIAGTVLVGDGDRGDQPAAVRREGNASDLREVDVLGGVGERDLPTRYPGQLLAGAARAGIWSVVTGEAIRRSAHSVNRLLVEMAQ
jgi:hypothetical protein